MNRQDVFNLTSDFRNNIYVQSFTHHMTVVDFEQWGAGEYKVGFNIAEKFGKFIHLYIPYATISTLEKAIVFTRFAEKQGITIVTSLVGYVAYGRQERETDSEPELLVMTKLLLHQLTNVHVIDPHDMASMRQFKHLFFTKVVDQGYPSNTYVIAPDKGADERNSTLDINSHIVIDKYRYDGEVKSAIAYDQLYRHYRFGKDVTIEEAEQLIKQEPIDFIIYDDICDGGRTFMNVAKLVKEKYPNCKITLCVGHAILPFGTEQLKGHIDKIITLNTCFPAGTYDDGFIKVLSALDVFYK